jgi:hypothetical protein
MFTPTGSMITVQRVWSATLLQDGRVFVAGETDAEIYDPAGGTFAPTGAYVGVTPVSWGTVTLLVDGRILLTGCPVQCAVGATEIFDPKSGTFSITGLAMRDWGDVNTATLLMDGRVLFVGNADNDGSPGEAEVYDPAAGTFTFIGNTIAPHEFAAAVRLTDGTVLITGGQLPGGSGNDGCDLYLPASGTFVFAGGMTAGRHSHTATLLPDGTVLIVGGYSGWPTPTASAEIYKPQGTVVVDSRATGKRASLSQLPVDRQYGTLVRLPPILANAGQGRAKLRHGVELAKLRLTGFSDGSVVKEERP